MIPGIIRLPVAIVNAALALSTSEQPQSYPFAVGEHFEYVAKLGILSVGTASMNVASIDTVRGHRTYYFKFRLDGGNRLFKIQNTLESWTTVTDFKSLRFRNDNKENDKARLRVYDIYPDSGFYRLQGHPEAKPTPKHPLDDASLVYFIRNQKLEVGKRYKYENYFVQEKNPLVVTVLKRESMKLPDGTSVQCLVLQPVIGDKGMFSNRAKARLWLTDDERRIPVKIETTLFATVTLNLQKMTFGSGD